MRSWATRTRVGAGALALLTAFGVVVVPPPAAAEVYGGVNFPQGASSFADVVTAYDPVIKNGEPTAQYRTPHAALGTPNNASVTLGDGGSITLQFTDNRLTGSGTTAKDLWIFEIGPDVEDTFVEVSADGIVWRSVGAVGGATAGVDIDAFGLGPAAQLAFVRLRDHPDLDDQFGASVGADIDAVGAISSNAAPVAGNDSYTTPEDKPLTVAKPGVLANDSDPNGPVTAHFRSAPAHGQLSLQPDGSFTYAPDADYCGADSFTYEARDQQGVAVAASVTFDVTCVNDPPRSGDEAFGATEDTLLAVPAPGVLANDSDPEGDPLAAHVVDVPAHGQLALQLDGSFDYAPDADYCGADVFRYEVSDPSGLVTPATSVIDVACVNDAPIAEDDVFAATEDTVLVAFAPGVLENDSDVDGDSLIVELVEGPVHGDLTLQPDGSFDYTPAPDYAGPDSFTYAVHDGNGGRSTARAVIDVENVAESTGLTAEPAIAEVGADGVSVNVGRLRATLIRDDGEAIIGVPIVFRAGGTELCTATTDAAGVATCEDVVASISAVVSLGYTATFAGDDDHDPATTSAPLIVLFGQSLPSP